MHKKSVMMLFSDLMAEPESTLKAVRMMRAGRRSAYVFHIIDPAERDPPWTGAVFPLRASSRQASAAIIQKIWISRFENCACGK